MQAYIFLFLGQQDFASREDCIAGANGIWVVADMGWDTRSVDSSYTFSPILCIFVKYYDTYLKPFVWIYV
jgi:hypothetical protein